jgi:hypothetical protein
MRCRFAFGCEYESLDPGTSAVKIRFGALTVGLLVVAAATAARTWAITVCGPASDPRRAAVADAVDFWNEQLTGVGAKLSLGPITACDRVIPDDLLTRISEGVLSSGRAGRLPPEFDKISGDVIILLSNADLISVGMSPSGGRPGVVILRRPDVPPLSLPNVARNVVAHELGHVLGLPHTADPTLLMCGRPASCRPALFQSATRLFFPLTDQERRDLGRRFR